MRLQGASSLLHLLAISTAAAQAPASRGALATGTYAITDVAVVPMTSDTVIRDATVIVRDGRIAEVGPSRGVRVPADVRRVDGAGKFLIPGLADMHTHLYSDGETPDSVAPYELGVMVANGVTTTRLMIGTPEHLVLRRDVALGRVLGPMLWVASPQFAGKEEENGVVVATPEQARAAVRQVVDAGYDFVKLTTDITPEVYDAVTEEARRRGIRVVGHVDPRVGVPRALAAGQHIEHLDGYFESVMADSAPSDLSISNYGIFKPRNWETLDHVDDAKVDRIAKATAKAGVWSTPTLHLFNTAFGTGETDEAMRSRGDWSMITPEIRRLYLGARTKYWKQAATEARRRRYVEVRNTLTRKIVEAGGKIMAGSDTPEWLMVYGWEIHREIEAFVAAGLTPYQALQTATTTPAEFLKATDWGTIRKGMRADLVLLAGNPLDDIRNTARIEAVAVGGRWIPRGELDRMIATAAGRLDGVPAAGAAAQAPLDPRDFPADLAPLVQQVAPVFAARPADPSVLYQVAALHARAGHTELALTTLHRLAEIGSGVDPRLRDGFQSLADHPEFQAITARIRREHPPVNHARLAFDIAEGTLVPEGIAWSARTRKLHFGTAHRIVSATLDGKVADFVRPGVGGLGAVAGMRVDDARGELWATSIWLFGPAPPGTITGLFRFRLADGSLVARYPAVDSSDFVNDIAIAPDGVAYATHTNSGALMRVDPRTGRSDLFLPPGALPDPNGIAASADGRYLFVAGWYGITRIDRATRHTIVLGQPANVASGCLDGLYLRGEREIVAVQNCVHHSGRIMHFALNPARDSIVSATVLESYNPLFESITTAAVVGDTLYFVANVQFRKIGRDGKPTAPVNPLHVMALPLPPLTTTPPGR